MLFPDYGILGQNARNLDYIRSYNDKLSRRLADSKLKTKDFLGVKGVAVVPTLKIIHTHEEIVPGVLDGVPLPFVIKPNAGFGGKGILIIDAQNAEGNYVTNSGKIFSETDLLLHLRNTLDGFFSLSGVRDSAIIEKKVVLSSQIELIGKYGLPDIRVLVFNMVPVMAMLRVPTEKSGGKANLHAGACGVGIDIGSGKLTYITHKGKVIKTIPGIGDIRGIKIPDWEKILHLAVKVQKITKIGYLGCDIVLDKQDGPLLLEMNARSGLELQTANLAPLKDRLERVEGVNVKDIDAGVRIGRDLFIGDLEERIKNISGRKVLGNKEFLNIEHNEKSYKYVAEIDSTRQESYMDKKFLQDAFGLDEHDLSKKAIKFKCNILGTAKTLRFLINDAGEEKISLGYADLRGFLIDPNKYKKGELPFSEDFAFLKEKNSLIHSNYKKQLLAIDSELFAIDKKLLILKNITPVNVAEEREEFIASEGKYIPKFQYREKKLELVLLQKRLDAIEIQDIPLKNMYIKKKREVQNKIYFLKALKQGDNKDIETYSRRLFGVPTEENLLYSNEILSEKKVQQEQEFLSFDEIRDMVKKFNHIYKINISVKKRQSGSRFAMSGNTLLYREGDKVGKKELRSIIAHEIEGHYLRKMNGKNQDYKIFSVGSAGYIILEEGMAIYNQNRFLSKTDRKYYGVFERYYFLHYALNHSYKKLLKKMLEYYDNDYKRVFNYIYRLKRGMTSFDVPYNFTKDAVYVNGYRELQRFIDAGGDIRELYVGKLTIEDLQEVKESYLIPLYFNKITLPFFL